MYTFFFFRNSGSSVAEADSCQVFHFRVIDFSSVASCTIDFSELNVVIDRLRWLFSRGLAVKSAKVR